MKRRPQCLRNQEVAWDSEFTVHTVFGSQLTRQQVCPAFHVSEDMGKNDVLIKVRYTDMNYVYVKKRKAGSELNLAVAEAVRKKHKKDVTVASWFLPETPDIHDLAPDTTAEEVSSQEAEAIVQPVMDLQAEIEELKTQTQILMSQAVSDFERRVRNVASLVMGRLVRSASVSTPAKSALSTYFSQSQKQRHLQQLLTKNGLQSTPQNFARHFDSLYSARCGKAFCVRLFSIHKDKVAQF